MGVTYYLTALLKVFKKIANDNHEELILKLKTSIQNKI